MTYVDFDGIAIIESLDPAERQTGTALYQHLQTHQNAGKIILSHHPVMSRAGFFNVLDGIQRTITAGGRAPLLHLELHGNRQGLFINNGETVSWEDFAECCRDINIALKNHLVVTLAVCKGAYAESGANPQWRTPYFGIIGSFDTEYAPSLATGFQAFYDELLTQQDFNIAHANLQKHLPRFELIDAAGLFVRVYEKYRNTQLSLGAIQERIDNVTLQAPSGLNQQVVRDDALNGIIQGDWNNRVEFWRSFVMADLDPRNATRCPLPTP